MRKQITFLSLILFSLLFVSCGEVEKEEDTLIGSKWTVTFLSYKYIIEFTSATNARFFEADENNNYKNYLQEGTYSYADGNVTFGADEKLFIADVISMFMCNYYYLKTATVSGDVMKVTTRGKKLTFHSLNEGDYTEEEISGKSFTLMRIN